MSDTISNTNNITAAVQQAMAPETFDFAAAVQNRSFPEFDVAVYLDEKSVQDMLALTTERSALELRISQGSKPSVEVADQLEAIDAKYSALVDSLRAQRYNVKIRGISPDVSIKLEEQAAEAFPIEYVDTVHPATGAPVHTEVENEDRQELFVSLIRQAHLVSVTSPTGAVDANFSDLEKVKSLWRKLPLVARIKLDQAIHDATIATDFYMELVDEVF